MNKEATADNSETCFSEQEKGMTNLQSDEPNANIEVAKMFQSFLMGKFDSFRYENQQDKGGFKRVEIVLNREKKSVIVPYVVISLLGSVAILSYFGYLYLIALR